MKATEGRESTETRHSRYQIRDRCTCSHLSFVLLSDPDTFSPFRDRRTNYYQQYERARRESGSSYNGHEDGGFKVHGALVPRVFASVRFVSMPPIPPLGSFRVFNWKYRLSFRCRKLRREFKCALVCIFLSLFFAYVPLVICVHLKNHNHYGNTRCIVQNSYTTRNQSNELHFCIFDSLRRTCRASSLRRCN